MKTLRSTTLIAIFALVLSGCSAFGGTKSEPEQFSTTSTAAPVIVPEVTAEPMPVRTRRSTGLIDIENVLEKLNATGCTVDKLTYREVDDASRTGGHVDITCTKRVDALSTDNDL